DARDRGDGPRGAFAVSREHHHTQAQVTQPGDALGDRPPQLVRDRDDGCRASVERDKQRRLTPALGAGCLLSYHVSTSHAVLTPQLEVADQYLMVHAIDADRRRDPTTRVFSERPRPLEVDGATLRLADQRLG